VSDADPAPDDRRAALVDALVHLDNARLAGVDASLRAAREAGVRAALFAGVDPCAPAGPHDVGEALSRDGIELWRAHGLHPRAVDPARIDAQLEALAARLRGAGEVRDVCAIGEVGLDARDGMPPLDAQERALSGAVWLARAHGLPLVLHVVRALPRALELLERLGGLPAGGVLHGFAGPRELLERAFALDLDVSVGGLALRPNARRLRAALPHVPLGRLLVETDAPDLPLDALPRVVDAVAALRREPPDLVARATAENAARRFSGGRRPRPPPSHR